MSKKNRLYKKTLYVNGMHCASCEILVEKTLLEENYIQKVEASLQDRSVKIVSSTPLKEQILDKKLGEFGYKLSSTKPKSKFEFSFYEFSVAFSFFIFLAVFFYIFDLGKQINFQLSSSSNYLAYFIFGIFAGLSSCAALIGGMLLSLSKNWTKQGLGKKGFSKYSPFIKFNTSRILTFGFLGGLLGLVGSYFSISFTLTFVLTMLVSLIMLYVGLQSLGFTLFKIKTPSFFLDKNITLDNKYIPYILGAATFFIPCGFTLVAQTQALTSASFASGFFKLFAFSLGTLPVLALISFSSVNLYKNKSISIIFNYFVGLVLIFFAFSQLWSQFNLLNFQGFSQSKNTIQVDGNKEAMQELNFVATGFEYTPAYQEINAGIPTKITFTNNGAVGCANAVYSRGLFSSVMILENKVNEQIVVPKKGTYKVSCSMGMVNPVTVVVK